MPGLQPSGVTPPDVAAQSCDVCIVGAGLAGIAIAFAPAPGGAGAGRVALRLLAITLVALCLRAAVSLLFDGGTYDIFFAYRKLGDELRHGGDVYAQRLPSLANYPPVIYWWWSLAATIVPSGSPHLFAALVRAPFWMGDAAARAPHDDPEHQRRNHDLGRGDERIAP